MGIDVGLFARMFVIGIVVAAPVGAMGILCIQRVLAHGWRAGLATGAGIATADAGYAALAAFGVTAVATWMIAYQAPLRIVGGLALLWLGWRAVRTPAAQQACPSAPWRGTWRQGRANGGRARRGRVMQTLRATRRS